MKNCRSKQIKAFLMNFLGYGIVFLVVLGINKFVWAQEKEKLQYSGNKQTARTDSISLDSLSKSMEVAKKARGAADSLSVLSDSLSVLSDSLSVLSDSLARTLNRAIPNYAFQVGEKLTFRIRYGIITAGKAIMEVKNVVTVKDSFPAYHIVTTAKSNRTFDFFYKVRDEVETFLDVKGLFSWKYYKRLREGSYKYDLLVDYDQLVGSANIKTIRYHKKKPLKVKKENKFQMKIPEYVLDVLGAFYYIRTQKLTVGQPVYLSNHNNKKIYDLQVVVQKKERIKVKAGKFNCIVVSPRLKGEGLFKQKGEMWIWLTDDEYKIPVQMKSKIIVGSITTELVKIEGVSSPRKAHLKSK